MTLNKRLYAFTEHQRLDELSEEKHTFRANPSYRDDSGQDANVWFDWALFDMDDSQIPCQILCFIKLTNLSSTDHTIGGYPINVPGNYAVIRRFLNPAKSIPHSNFIQQGFLMNDLYLIDCESILAPIAVVPANMIGELGEETNLDSPNKFLVVKNRTAWIEFFMTRMRTVGAMSWAYLGEQNPLNDSDDDTDNNEYDEDEDMDSNTDNYDDNEDEVIDGEDDDSNSDTILLR